MLTLLISLLIAGSVPTHHMTTRATRYADTARDEGGTPACRWHLSREVHELLHPIRVASRTLPCGTLLVVQSRNGRALAAVLDRGPWGRHPAPTPPADGPFWSDSSHVGAYRGDLDISPEVANRIGLTLKVGRLRVRYWRVGWQPFVPARKHQPRLTI